MGIGIFLLGLVGLWIFMAIVTGIQQGTKKRKK
jgi:uncharacterized membrane protein